MENNHRIKILPEMFTKWLAGQNKRLINQQLKNTITKEVKKLGFDINDHDTLEKQILENDQKYYNLQETGSSDEYLVFFCKARLFSAAKFIQLGNFNDAIYEYFYSFNTDNPNEVIEDLKKHLTTQSSGLYRRPLGAGKAADFGC